MNKKNYIYDKYRKKVFVDSGFKLTVTKCNSKVRCPVHNSGFKEMAGEVVILSAEPLINFSAGRQFCASNSATS